MLQVREGVNSTNLRGARVNCYVFLYPTTRSAYYLFQTGSIFHGLLYGVVERSIRLSMDGVSKIVPRYQSIQVSNDRLLGRVCRNLSYVFQGVLRLDFLLGRRPSVDQVTFPWSSLYDNFRVIDRVPSDFLVMRVPSMLGLGSGSILFGKGTSEGQYLYRIRTSELLLYVFPTGNIGDGVITLMGGRNVYLGVGLVTSL